MTRYTVRFNVPAEVVVHLDADSEDEAADLAWEKANDLLAFDNSHGGATLFASVDGIGADEVEEARR